MQRILFAALFVSVPIASLSAQGKKKKKTPQIAPTAANVPYGDHPRQVIDFWKAKSEKPTPLGVPVRMTDPGNRVMSVER